MTKRRVSSRVYKSCAYKSRAYKSRRLSEADHAQTVRAV